MLKLVLALALLPACGSSSHGGAAPDQPSEPQQEPAYYAAEYEALAKPHLGQDFRVTTQFHVTATPAHVTTGVGDCDPTTNTVEMLQSYWDARNGTERKELIFHELGHCEQYRPHLNTKLPNGEPASLMTGGLLPDWITFRNNEADYETELFSVTETCGVGDALPCRTKT